MGSMIQGEITIGPESWNQESCDQWPDGLQVFLRPGIYRGPVQINKRVRLSSLESERRAVISCTEGPGTGALMGLILSGGPGSLLDLDFRGEDLSRHILLRIEGGNWSVVGCRFQGAYHTALMVSGSTAAPRVERCTIYGGARGIQVEDRAGGTFEGNELLDHLQSGVIVQGLGTNPLFRQNKICESMQSGVDVTMGASGRFEDNEVYGNAVANVQVRDPRTIPQFSGNRIHDGKRVGLSVSKGAGGWYDNNAISHNAATNVDVRDDGTAPNFTNNAVFGGLQAGLSIHHGACGVFEGNDIYENELANVFIYQAGTEPRMLMNKIHDGNHAGISVYGGAAGSYEGNDIFGNAQANVQVAHKGSNPVFRHNTIRLGKHGGIFVQSGAFGVFESNEVFDNAMANIEVIDSGSTPVFRENIIHSCLNEGIIVQNGASGRYDTNEIRANGFSTKGLNASGGGYPSIRISDPGTSPFFVSNRVIGAASAAFLISTGAGGVYENNEIIDSDPANRITFDKKWDIKWGTKATRRDKSAGRNP